MEKITTETLLATLFKYGFDKVDPVLYVLVSGKISVDNQENNLFDLRYDETLSPAFEKLFISKNLIYRINDKHEKTMRIEGTIVEVSYEEYFERYMKHYSNEKLYEYLSNLDFKEIIKKKLDAYGIDVSDMDKPFISKKEKEIIYGLDKESRKEKVKQLEKVLNSDLYKEVTEE